MDVTPSRLGWSRPSEGMGNEVLLVAIVLGAGADLDNVTPSEWHRCLAVLVFCVLGLGAGLCEGSDVTQLPLDDVVLLSGRV